jgi:hypothetical protein
MTSTVGQSITVGTQDFAALIGLVFTDAVERNAFSLDLGDTNLAISLLSLFGILGLVKSTLKIVVGSERCQAAGFNLDAVRGIFGYTALDASANPKMVDCDVVNISIDNRAVVIEKAKQYMEPKGLASVGSLWGTGPDGEGGRRLIGYTVIGLGNVERETGLNQNIWLQFALGHLCAGTNASLLLLIAPSWNWVLGCAVIGMYVSLIAIIAIPLVFSWRTRRPWLHLTPATWKTLISGGTESRRLHLLQCRVGNGDVLHFQGDTRFLRSWPLRAYALLASVALTLAYICQYSVVSRASNEGAILWMSCQTVAAFVRLFYWISKPKWGDTEPENSQYALILNNAASAITLPELICACKPGKTVIPMWAWEYLRVTNLSDIIRQGGRRGMDDVIPVDAEWVIISNQDFNSIIRKRSYGALPEHTHHELHLAFWRKAGDDSDKTVHPFFVIVTRILRNGQSSNCFMEASLLRVEHGNLGSHVKKPCSIFAVNIANMERLHLRPYFEPHKCDPNCAWKHATSDCERDDTIRFLWDRSRMCPELVELADAGVFGNSDEEQVALSAGLGMSDSHGPWGTRNREDGINRITQYLDGELGPHLNLAISKGAREGDDSTREEVAEELV